jgi:hypothetical protein
VAQPLVVRWLARVGLDADEEAALEVDEGV